MKIDYDSLENEILTKLDRELSASLYYHCTQHTKDVIAQSMLIAQNEGVTEEDKLLLKFAALFHDIGFVNTYKNHEAESKKIAKQYLNNGNLTPMQIETICKMIMATKVPQKPKSHLERIICDADLLYLGTDNFDTISNQLYRELTENKLINSEKDWYNIQNAFLEKHSFHTQFAQENYKIYKSENLDKVKNWLAIHTDTTSIS